MPAEQITERFQRQPERFAVTLIDVSSQILKEFNRIYINCDHCGGPLEIHGEEASLPAFSGCFGLSLCIGCLVQ
jgi:hypothetical protein